MDKSEFSDGCNFIKDWNIVIVGCGAQGLNQGLNMRDSGCDVSYALREVAIEQKRASFVNAQSNGFTVGTYDDLIPTADLVLNLTPDKQHTPVVAAVPVNTPPTRPKPPTVWMRTTDGATIADASLKACSSRASRDC